MNERLIERVIKSEHGKLDGELLHETLFVTHDEELASKSCCQFFDREGGGADISLLGFINGILPELTGMCLTMVIEDAELLDVSLTGRERVEMSFKTNKVTWRVQEKWWSDKEETDG